MKFIKELKRSLDRLNLGVERESDLLSKYMLADAELEKEMNRYFGLGEFNRTQEKINPSIKKAIKKAIVKSEPVRPNTQEYYGSNARNFDHRTRAAVDTNHQLDKSLDDKYFQN